MNEQTTQADDAALALASQARCREQGIPVLTSLCGPVARGVAAWRRWASAADRPIVQTTSTDVRTAVTLWVEAAARTRDLVTDTLTFLAHRVGRNPEELRDTCRNSSLLDWARFWDGLALDWQRQPALAACHWLLERYTAGEVVPPETLAARLQETLPDQDRPMQSTVVALAGLVPPVALPALLLVPPVPLAPDWVGAAADLLASLVLRLPALPAALTAERDTIESYLRAAPESQACVLLREGLTPLPPVSEVAVAQQLAALNLPANQAANALPTLLVAGASPALLTAFADVAAALSQPGEGANDESRSAAERFLFELLNGHPHTAGLFQLNGPLDFRFGPKDAEVDLLARDLRLAVELDGFYHFVGPEGYRRDRRKDWELQRRGYLVLRFAVADVVARLEEILDTILAAVDHCRRNAPSRRAITP